MNLKNKTVVIDNKIYRYSKIVMLSTNKGFSCKKFNGLKIITGYICSCEYLYGYLTDIKYLYFLSTDKICEGDWCIIKDHNCNCAMKVSKIINNAFVEFYSNKYLILNQPIGDCFKVISSTNPECNLPKPSESFIKAYIDSFNKGEKIEECLVEHTKHFDEDWTDEGGAFEIEYETLKVTKGEITIRKIKDSWSREEVTNNMYLLLKDYFLDIRNNITNIKLVDKDTYCENIVNNWIKQNL